MLKGEDLLARRIADLFRGAAANRETGVSDLQQQISALIRIGFVKPMKVPKGSGPGPGVAGKSASLMTSCPERTMTSSAPRLLAKVILREPGALTDWLRWIS